MKRYEKETETERTGEGERWKGWVGVRNIMKMTERMIRLDVFVLLFFVYFCCCSYQLLMFQHLMQLVLLDIAHIHFPMYLKHLCISL